MGKRGRPRKNKNIDEEMEDDDAVRNETEEGQEQEKKRETVCKKPSLLFVDELSYLRNRAEIPVEKEKTREDHIRDAGPLGPGQKYFECPDGRILIGESTKGRLYDRATGSFVNPMRD
jgi:hypothetical protein